MNNNQHPYRNEICLWANSPLGTEVWYKRKNTKDKWTCSISVLWNKDYIHIVDNEWAELRKAQIDGKQLQFKGLTTGQWYDTTLKYEDINNSYIQYWRIKPEPVYEWQFLMYDECTKTYALTDFMTQKEGKKLGYEKFDKSKRIKK